MEIRLSEIMTDPIGCYAKLNMEFFDEFALKTEHTSYTINVQFTAGFLSCNEFSV